MYLICMDMKTMKRNIFVNVLKNKELYIHCKHNKNKSNIVYVLMEKWLSLPLNVPLKKKKIKQVKG